MPSACLPGRAKMRQMRQNAPNRAKRVKSRQTGQKSAKQVKDVQNASARLFITVSCSRFVVGLVRSILVSRRTETKTSNNIFKLSKFHFMGRYFNGVMGAVVGTVGTVVGSSWKGKKLLRGKAVRLNKTKTQKHLIRTFININLNSIWQIIQGVRLFR